MSLLKKLFQLLQESLPAKRRIYFIYTHKNGYNRFANGLKANTELSFWGYTGLKKEFGKISFLKFQGEKPSRIAAINSNDVVIGHVGETFMKASTRTQRLISFAPWVGHEDHSKESFNCLPFEKEIEFYNRACSLILLTSEYNKKHYLETNTNFWYPFFQEFQKSKKVRVVHQPIDTQLFRRIKWEYTTDNFIYIGNDGHMKGLKDADNIVRELGKNFTIYGLNGKKIDHLDQKAVSKLPQEGDFFIQPGMWEAQCVSILEAAARGFIPVVSKETGYPYDHPFMLRYGDFEYNVKVLKELLKTSPEERKALADHLHGRLIHDANHNDWENLVKVLVEAVKEVL